MVPILLDDHLTEALLTGEAVDERFDALVDVLAEARGAGWSEPPEPTGELASLFAAPDLLHAALAPTGPDATATDADLSPGKRQRHLRAVPSGARRVARVAGGLGLVAKLALGAGAAAAAVGGAGVAGVLPTPLQEIVDDVTHVREEPSSPGAPSPGGIAPMTTRGLDPRDFIDTSTTTRPQPSTTTSGGSSTPADETGSKQNDPPSHAGAPGNAGGNGNGPGSSNAGGNGNGPGSGNAGGNGNGAVNGNGPGTSNAGGNGNGVGNGDPGRSGEAGRSGDVTGEGGVAEIAKGSANGNAGGDERSKGPLNSGGD